MKTTYLWLAFLCIGLFAFRPLSWVPVELDSRVSVSMPAQPKVAAMPEPVKMLSVKDATGAYVVIATALGKDFQGAERKGYYDSMIESLLEGGKGKLLSRSTFTLGNYEGIAFAAVLVRPDNQQPMPVFARCIIVDKKCYVLQFLPAGDAKNGEAQSKPFLDSITLH